MRKFFLFILACIAMQLNVRSQVIPAAQIPVSYNVTPSGAFAYSLPIEIPPGISGLVPNLSINYNSQAGNGVMGIGWSLGGLSAITRGGTDLYHDSNLDPADLDANDVFLLDGQRLISIGSNMYMTEMKNFAKITRFGTAGTGPAYFKVEYPDGSIFMYGAKADLTTTDARQLIAGKTEVATWMIKQIVDKNSNTVDFVYYNNQATGQIRISQIKYTGHIGGTAPPQNTINFTYNTTRSDINKFWIEGTYVKEEARLTQIDIIHNNSTAASKYTFTYDNDIFTRLTEIWQYRGASTFPPIKINWGTNNGTVVETVNNIPSSIFNILTVGDFNGDGATDIAKTTQGSTINNQQIYHSNKLGDFVSPYFSNYDHFTASSNGYSPNVSASDGGRIPIDFDGDGLDDLAIIEPYSDFAPTVKESHFKIHIYLSTRTGIEPEDIVFHYINGDMSNHQDFLNTIKLLAGDFDGDSRRDLMVFVASDLGSAANHYPGQEYDAYIVGHQYNSGQSSSGNWGQVLAGNYTYVGHLAHEIGIYKALDYNGDGRDDIMLSSGNSPLCGSVNQCNLLTLSSTFSSGELTSAGMLTPLGSATGCAEYPTSGHKKIWTGDFNGDGKSDILTWLEQGTSSNPAGTWNIAYSKGTITVETGTLKLKAFDQLGGNQSAVTNASGGLLNVGPWYPLKYQYHVADFNGDGKDDILQIYDAIVSGPTHDIYYIMYYSKGDDFYVESGALPDDISIAPGRQTVGDFDGDGQADVLVYNSTVPIYIIHFRKNDQKHIVKSIDHAGKQINVTHKSLAEFGDFNDHYKFVPWTDHGMTQDDGRYFSRQIPFKVVTSISDNVSLSKSFRYETLTMHTTGLGFQGFRKIFTIDNVNEKVEEDIYTRYAMVVGTSNGSIHLPSPVLQEVKIHSLDDYDNQVDNPLSQVENFYLLTPGHAPTGLSLICKNYQTIETNRLTGLHRETNTNYNYVSGPSPLLEQFGQPDNITVNTTTHTGGDISEVTSFVYNISAPFNQAQNPISVTKTVTYPSKPAYARTTLYGYDAAGNRDTVITDPNTANQKTNANTYDLYGNLTKVTLTSVGLPNVVTDFTISSDKRFPITKTTHLLANNYVTTTEYNLWGTVKSNTEITGLKTQFTYDLANRLLTTTTPDGVVSNKSYGWAYSKTTDNPTSLFTDYTVITSNQGAAQTYVEESTTGISGANTSFIDFYGRTVRKVKPSSSGTAVYEDATYNNKGELTDAKSAYPVANPSLAILNHFTYDEHSRIRQSTSTFGPTIATTYQSSISPAYFKTTVTNTSPSPSQQKITYSDPTGTYKVEENTSSIDYGYNSNGSPDDITINNDATNFNTHFNYDNYGRMVRKVEPNSPIAENNYNAYDQVTTDLDDLPKYTYTYDAIGRILTKTETSVPSNVYTYEYYLPASTPSTGKLKKITAPASAGHVIEYTYDVLGRPQSVIETNNGLIANTFTTAYQYDPYSRVSQITYPSGNKIAYTYNSYGFLNDVSIATGSVHPAQFLWGTPTRNHNGQVTEVVNFKPGAMASSFTYRTQMEYDLAGRLISKKVSDWWNSSTIYFWHEYGYDNATGNMTLRRNAKTTPNLVESFGYNANYNRLTSVSTSAPSVLPLQMEYDDLGNIKKKSDVTTSSDLWLYKKYALYTLADPASSIPTFVIPQNTQTVNYSRFYKADNITENTASVAYVYGAEQERIRARYFMTPGGLVKTKYYATNYEKIVTAAGIVENVDYVFADGELIAILYQKTGQSPAVYHTVTDHLGSIVQLLDNAGGTSAVVEERSFDAWGRTRNPTTWQYYTPATTPAPGWLVDRGYTGHEHVWMKGTYDHSIINMNGRLYDPLVGRMFSADPVVADNTNSQAYNKYTYAFNNPLSYIDPDGNNPVLLGIAVGAAISAAKYAYDISRSSGGFENWDWGSFGGTTFTGGVIGGMSGGVGNLLGPIGSTTIGKSVLLTEGTRAALHGALGFAGSGGELSSGVAGAFGSLAGSYLGISFGGTFQHGVGGLVASATIGGAASVITGGDFLDGAAWASIGYIANQAAHRLDNARNGEPTYTLDQFLEDNLAKSYNEIIAQRPMKSGLPGGPLLRYVKNPVDGNVMDMRHVMIVGFGYGEGIGRLFERFQGAGGNGSAYDPQDYYSNRIGAQFRNYMDSHFQNNNNNWTASFYYWMHNNYKR